MPRIVAGIDPGLNGGITFIEEYTSPGVVQVPLKIVSYPMPTLKVGTHTVIDSLAVAAMLRPAEGYPDINTLIVMIEKVGAMPGQGVTSMFTFGYGAGILEGICAALRIPYKLVTPQTWQKKILVGLPKGEGGKSSVLYCQRKFPQVDWKASSRCKKAHDGMTDSACLAVYAAMEVGIKV